MAKQAKRKAQKRELSLDHILKSGERVLAAEERAEARAETEKARRLQACFEREVPSAVRAHAKIVGTDERDDTVDFVIRLHGAHWQVARQFEFTGEDWEPHSADWYVEVGRGDDYEVVYSTDRLDAALARSMKE